MATHCEDVSTRMMELLYGELSADERATIEAHVAGCARCRSELDGFEKTRAAARRALDEAPPARVRAAIVKAAAEHLAAQAQPAARKPAAPDKMSLWDRLRAVWVFPTLATVGALAVFVVANRVFVNPERALQHAPATAAAPSTPPAPPELARQAPSGNERFDETAQKGARFEQDKKAIAPPTDLPGGGDEKQRPSGGYRGDDRALAKDAVGEGAMHAAPQPSAVAPRKKSIGDDRANDFVPKRPGKPELDPPLTPAPFSESGKRFRDEPRTSSSMQFAPPPPPREAPAHAKGGKAADKVAAKKDGFENDLLEGGEASSGSRRAATKPPAAPTGSLDEMLDAQPGKARAGGGGVGLAGPKNKADGYGSGAAQGSAAPAMRNEATKRPAPAASGAPAPAPAAAPAMAAAPAPVSPPPAPAPRAHAAKTAATADYDAEEMEAPAQAKKEKKPASGGAGAMETLAQRADRLFAERRWTAAAEAYRDLLRRDPHNDDADRWRRQRQIAAENADVSGNASIAEKRAAEAKSPRKPAAAKASKRAVDSDAASSAPAAAEQQR